MTADNQQAADIIALQRSVTQNPKEKKTPGDMSHPECEYQWIGLLGKILTGNHGKITIKYMGFLEISSHHPIL